MEKSQLIENTVLGGILTLFNRPATAEKATTIKKDGKEIVHYSPSNLNRASIELDGKTRIFECINRADADPVTGFKAMAWIEMDPSNSPKPQPSGKYNVIITFPGFVSSALGLEETGDERSVNAIIDRGEANPQIAHVPKFVGDTLAALKARNIDSNAAMINIGGHSMGSSNAIYANHLFHEKGLESHAILIEPYAASLAVDSLSKKMGIEKASLTKDVTSIRSAPLTLTARATIPGSPTHNFMVGESFMLDMETPPGAIPPGENANQRHLVYSVVTRLLNNPDMLHPSPSRPDASQTPIRN